MINKLFLIIAFVTALPMHMFSQAKQRFSGDPGKFKVELTAFLGPNLNTEQSSVANTFYSKWDSSGFSHENMEKIIDISAKLASRNFRISPHFIDFLRTQIVKSASSTTVASLNLISSATSLLTAKRGPGQTSTLFSVL